MAALRDAAMFLTRIPIHRNNDQAPNMGAAVPWFAAIGLILGLIQGGVYAGLHEISTPTVAAALSAALLAQITGAFHLDGLADMADAFGGGWTQEQRLEILKDSRLGTYGVTALIFVIIIEIAALSALAGWLAVAATVAAHTASRAVASFMMIIAKPARDSGLSVDYLTGLSRPAVIGASLLVTAGAITLFGVVALPLILGAYGAGALTVRLAINKIGGISGDVLGAIQQLAKVTILVIIVIADDTTTDLGLLGGLALG
ncbi:MAG: adenosylcobinamide-GDP ribazoletransferase [Acidimicrobiales bacterium]|jgi:adenosylcobinamide-GDP ribazoletransferase